LDELVWVFTSQPSAGLRSQSAWLAVQDAIAQAPAVHVAVALGSAQAWPHDPQLDKVVMSTSHPFQARPSQSANPGAHEDPHVVPAQVAAVWAGAGQTFSHEPQ